MERRQSSNAYNGPVEVALPGDPVKRWGALMVLLLLGGLAIAGPWGALAWHENASVLSGRQAQIAILEEEIGALENRVDLLDPDAVDPDLAGELARRNLGVLHADEVVVTLPER
ncbi:MAG: septum formation initiator family protein [Pseudomonadota bacterium]